MPDAELDLSVITATWQRPALLAHCLRQFTRQSCSGLKCEHVIVLDGHDPASEFLVRREGARLIAGEGPRGAAGAAARDEGIRHSRGKYVCFWDDDNLYDPHALATLFAAACGADVGVVRTRHRLRKGLGAVTIPRRWLGRFQPGDIDTMCVCVRRELAELEPWSDGNSSVGTDIRWLTRVQERGANIRYVPVIIGEHL